VIGKAQAVERSEFAFVLAELPAPEGRALDRDVGQPRVLPGERAVGVGDGADPLGKPCRRCGDLEGERREACVDHQVDEFGLRWHAVVARHTWDPLAPAGGHDSAVGCR
jgi:hypothetical protein